MNQIVFKSVLTCPHCGFAQRETMPADACPFFYECRDCHVMLRPHSLRSASLSSASGNPSVRSVLEISVTRCIG
ncbi:GDCCVxC domain-containing (seleno)protein [Burkholderia stabilis]|uniref:GDCCVxC domain-containing (seleno)protein n=1 Tax=Burkholderia stabilis TaxID=95485 RepID=UPI0013E94E4D|nr:GDCCVxC domain-containing (seleno)protein [Burkholderia stabilis]